MMNHIMIFDMANYEYKINSIAEMCKLFSEGYDYEYYGLTDYLDL